MMMMISVVGCFCVMKFRDEASDYVDILDSRLTVERNSRVASVIPRQKLKLGPPSFVSCAFFFFLSLLELLYITSIDVMIFPHFYHVSRTL